MIMGFFSVRLDSHRTLYDINWYLHKRHAISQNGTEQNELSH